MESADPLEDEARKLPQQMLNLIHARKPNLSAEILFAMFAGMFLCTHLITKEILFLKIYFRKLCI